MAILDWLNRNAGALQAFAAFFQVVATIVLVAITARYVRLTSVLSRAATDQAAAARQQAQAATDALELEKAAREEQRNASFDRALEATEKRWAAVGELRDVAERLLDDLQALPEPAGSRAPIDRLRSAHVPDPDSVRHVLVTAELVGEETAQMARTTAAAIAWLRDRIQRVQDVPVGPASTSLGSLFGQEYGERREDAIAWANNLLMEADAEHERVFPGTALFPANGGPGY